MPAVRFARFRDEVLALYEPPLRRSSTWYKMRRVLWEFEHLAGVKRTSDVTPLAMARWLKRYSHRAPMTNSTYLGAFRAACRYAKEAGYMRATPWDFRKQWVSFDFDEEDEPAPRHLSIAEIQRFLHQLDAEALTGDWCAGRLQALGYTYVHTGLRTREALGLKRSDVILALGVIRIRSRRMRKLKTRTSIRVVGIPADLADVYERWLPRCDSEWLFPGKRKTKPWLNGSTGQKPLDQIKAVAGRAGIESMTIQCLRRSIATHARRLGIDRTEVKELLGHGSLATQEWYQEQDVDNARHLASRIRFRDAVTEPRILAFGDAR